MTITKATYCLVRAGSAVKLSHSSEQDHCVLVEQSGLVPAKVPGNGHYGRAGEDPRARDDRWIHPLVREVRTFLAES